MRLSESIRAKAYSSSNRIFLYGEGQHGVTEFRDSAG